ncbi:MAG: calcium/sodium antiporter [Rhodothalassiaceae bacterium]
MILAIFQALSGLFLLIVAGDILVRGSVAIADRLKVPPLLIGLTIVAFGTSAPELFVSVDAVLRGAAPLALGNVVGSNIANALLVVGLPAVIAPLTCSAPRLNRNMLIMIGSSIVFIVLGLSGSYGRPQGLILLAGLAAFLVYSGRRAARNPEAAEDILDFQEEIGEVRGRLWLAILMVGGGIIGLVYGADLLVGGSVAIATRLGVSEAVIGLTLVALGTSLPELATSIAAALRCHCDVALGNVIGSNIFNVLGIMGVASSVGTVPVPEGFLVVDFWVMLGASLIILPFTLRRVAIGRLAGVLLVGLYCAYVGWLAIGSDTGAEQAEVRAG